MAQMIRNPLSRRIASLALGLGVAAAAAADGVPPTPNLVVIMADDLGYGDVSCYGGIQATPTPHIDRLAREGVLFTDAYVTAPVCGPSRAGFMTGRYQNRFGLTVNDHANQFIPDGEPTLARSLAQVGYRNACVGKWHLGWDHGAHPFDRGFHEYFGAPQWTHYLPQADGEPIRLYRGREEVVEHEYVTDAYTREAVDFVRRHADERFFLFLSHWAPHRPNEASQEYLDRFQHIPEGDGITAARGSRRIHHAMVSALDDSVGAVLAALEERGIDDDTLVVFLSDNGAPTPENRGSNGPFRGYKKDLWEGGIRVPFVVRWPGRIPGGRVARNPVIALDVYATMVELARTPTPERPLDGRNLWPLLSGASTAGPHDENPLYWQFGTNQRALRRGRYKYLRFEDEAPMVFDLWNDPFETRFGAAERGRDDLAEDLGALMAAWEAEMPPSRGGEDPRPLSASRPFIPEPATIPEETTP